MCAVSWGIHIISAVVSSNILEHHAELLQCFLGHPGCVPESRNKNVEVTAVSIIDSGWRKAPLAISEGENLQTPR